MQNPYFLSIKYTNAVIDQGIPIKGAGISALNKTEKGEHVQAVGSDPNDPTYVGIVEVFHQLHCLVSFSYIILT
jgi:hypothetical protein